MAILTRNRTKNHPVAPLMISPRTLRWSRQSDPVGQGKWQNQNGRKGGDQNEPRDVRTIFRQVLIYEQIGRHRRRHQTAEDKDAFLNTGEPKDRYQDGRNCNRNDQMQQRQKHRTSQLPDLKRGECMAQRQKHQRDR